MSDAPAQPTVVGERFRIDGKLATGGMGSVFHATDLRSGEEIALKRLREIESDRDVVLFEREYQTLASIQHPRIVKAYDYGVDALGPYYTMELVRGTDLHELAPVSARDACLHVRDVASCLALLHTRRLLHRDITPRNVRVLPDGTCKLLDFGALTPFGVPDRIVGTPPFVPPEALQQTGVLDQRSDIFSLGALLYWTLTRKHGYPARRIDALPDVWRERPISPRSLVPDMPTEVDALVMRMLNVDPKARPATMAEVVERLNAAASLEPESDEARDALAQSYLVHADFVGRDDEVAVLRTKLDQLETHGGSATLIYGTSGVGRTRMLSEMEMQGQLQGFNTLHIDGDDCRRDDHAARVILRHLLATSSAAREQAHVPAAVGLEQVTAVVKAASAETPIVMTIDNLDEVDDASLATLASLTRLSAEVPLCMLLAVRTDEAPRTSILWQLLRDQCATMTLGALSSDAAILMARSMFGDVPNVERFARWLHEFSGGLPLHIVELARRLHASGAIVYDSGLWHLPSERPEQIPDDGFAGLLATRLQRLTPEAHALAEALSVERASLSAVLCLELATTESNQQPRALLDELVRNEILSPTLYGYNFSHVTLRGALSARMSDARFKQLHLRCAERALASTQQRDPRRALIDAGWHLLLAGEESRGAERIAEAAVDTVAVRFALADTPEYAPAFATALEVYVKQGRSLYERLPLMSTLAHAGYYGDRAWGERYGDAAIAAVAEASGLTLARKLRPYIGRTLGVIAALTTAFLRFTLSRKRGPRYSFRDVMVQLFGVVTTLTGAASIALDVERATRIAATLEPFLGLPNRLTPVGIAQFCAGLKDIGRDNQARAVGSWETLLVRFRDPRYYPSLPADARVLYIGGLLFSLGAITVFRDGDEALKRADELDALGIKLYRMVASAIRAQHYAHRGQLEAARRARRQVDDHAVQVGSAWQAELWEPSSLTLAYTTMSDVAAMRSVADRLHELEKDMPSLERYAEFAEWAFSLTRDEHFGSEANADSARTNNLNQWSDHAIETWKTQKPRSTVGWGAIAGYSARAWNLVGRHEEARALCTHTLKYLNAGDLQFVALFLNLELELAVADAHLGQGADATTRLEALIVRHQHSDNPLTRGRLHEAYARVAAALSQWTLFRHHLEQTRAWYSRTDSASLIARVEAMRALDPADASRSMRAPSATIRHTQASLGIELPPDPDAPTADAIGDRVTTPGGKSDR